jgi:hypothetical protein
MGTLHLALCEKASFLDYSMWTATLSAEQLSSLVWFYVTA